MKNTKLVVSDKDFQKQRDSLTVVIIDDQKNVTSFLDKQMKRKIKYILNLGDFKGKKGEHLLLYPGSSDSKSLQGAPRMLMIGLGDGKEKNRTLLLEALRSAGGIVAAEARKLKAENVAIVLPDYVTGAAYYGAEQLVEGVILGDYQFTKYKKPEKPEDTFPGIKKITLCLKKNSSGVRSAARRAQYGCEAVLSARDMAHEPGNKWTPQQFADCALQLAASSELKCRIMDRAAMEKAGMGGLLAVSQGSAVPPKLVILEYVPKRHSKTILLVGKGLTFDSGGISIKPSAGMEDMKYDMCGGAAVLSTMMAVAEEKPGVRVIAMIPSSENLSGAKAVKPGDIITHYNGITSEVVNTDAEGRLILADALSYGIKKYKPDCVVDLATLTGAVIIALGHHRTGLVSNNDRLAELLHSSGEICGEPLWRLPLDEAYSKQIDSDVADIKNVGGKEGGSITAAAYLQKFVGDTPWAHLDIAGTAWDFTKKSYIPKGPSGVGVRTLIDFIRKWKKLQAVVPVE
ncbi:MAG: leucyl aminopeptidase [Desulfocapsaceae bacterium]|nr:leucyl aminopeptidase [Desulfocapsaceae bacterium]